MRKRPTIFVLPSTKKALSLVRERDPEGRSTIGNRLIGGSSPCGFIEKSSRDRVFSFTDQLVACGEANLLFKGGKAGFFVSSIEAWLVRHKGYGAVVWSADGWIRIRPNAPEDLVVNAVSRHLMQCTNLGDGWLAREFQAERTISFRARMALESIRNFRSCALESLGIEDSKRLRNVLEQLRIHEAEVERCLS